jgi:CRP-like cAMP-binding protein
VIVPTQNDPSGGQSAAELADSSILRRCSRRTLEWVLRTAERRVFATGSTIFNTGDSSDEFFIVATGAIGVCRGAPGQDRALEIAEVGPGEVFGEFALLGADHRLHTAHALTDSAVFTISPALLRVEPDGDAIKADLKQALSASVTGYLEIYAHQYSKFVKESEADRESHRQYAYFLSFLIVIFAVGQIFGYLFLDKIIKINVFSIWEYMGALTIPAICLVVGLKIPLADVGLTRHGLGKSLKEGAVASVIVVAFTAALFAANAWLDFLPYSRIHWEDMKPQYGLSALLQEFLARGVLQGSFRRYLDDRRGLVSVLLASVVFSLFHTQFGLIAVGLVFVSSLAFGAFYLRHQNIAGVTLFHTAVGYCGAVLGVFG